MTKYDNQLLSVLLTCFALSAPTNKNFKILSAFYGFIIIIFLMTCQIGILILKFNNTYFKYTPTMTVLDVLQSSILVLHNCAAILKANYHCDDDVQLTLNRIKVILKADTVHSYKYLEIVAAQFVVVVLLLFLLLTPMHRELGVYKYLSGVFFGFNIWLEMLVVMQIFYTNRLIMDNFRQLNVCIVKFVYKDSILTASKDKVDKAKHQQICTYIKLHSTLTDTMSITSGNFGVQLSLLCVLLIIVTIQGINVALKTATNLCNYYDEHLHLISVILGIIVIIHIVSNITSMISFKHVYIVYYLLF